MSDEEPANQRHRLYPPSVASIGSLPAAVLQVHCFSSIGPGHYRNVAGVDRLFRQTYSNKYGYKTTYESAAASVACAELCLKEG
jgi:hypothetical protein